MSIAPITARDVCPQCGHLWDEHTDDPPPMVTINHVLDGGSHQEPCHCCQRVAREVDIRNKERENPDDRD